MATTLLNKHTKFGAKILKVYWVITFLVLGHFLSRTLYTATIIAKNIASVDKALERHARDTKLRNLAVKMFRVINR